MTDSPFREPREVMDIRRLGAMHQTRLSFSRSIIRKIFQEKWKVNLERWDTDSKGYGTIIYRLKTKQHDYRLVVFSHELADTERSDRVIAEKWDITFALVRGEVNKPFLKKLKDNVPLQETGRTDDRVLVLSRANKSVRVFDTIVESLTRGEQPPHQILNQVGYILRTTAVYGNGKFGITDFNLLKDNPDFKDSFSAQMCAVYLLREFSLDLIHFLAKKSNPHAISLDKKIQRYLGVGNATGLGMSLFLIRHPLVVDNWLTQREKALSRIARKMKVGKTKRQQLIRLLRRAIQYLNKTMTIDKKQRRLNKKAGQELLTIIQDLQKPSLTRYQDLIAKSRGCSFEAQEIVISSVLELYPHQVDRFADWMNVEEEYLDISTLTVKDLLEAIKTKYSWCLKFDFKKAKNNYWFWYISKDKEEPRLGVREGDKGANKELPLDIARQVSRLYRDLLAEKASTLVHDLLLRHPAYRHLIKRVWTLSHCDLGEIQANTIAKDFLPIHILRTKLSLFGATKFDPRSDRWVRVTLFQNAPLLTDKKEGDWMFPVLEIP